MAFVRKLSRELQQKSKPYLHSVVQNVASPSGDRDRCQSASSNEVWSGSSSSSRVRDTATSISPMMAAGSSSGNGTAASIAKSSPPGACAVGTQSLLERVVNAPMDQLKDRGAKGSSLWREAEFCMMEKIWQYADAPGRTEQQPSGLLQFFGSMFLPVWSSTPKPRSCNLGRRLSAEPPVN
eukprot:gnl/MRDRNA2_/MRDRNA2_138939_c0_seq1.p1 gnl/MRDRNA2_/MRDRNA2_138939_c0~~gnl/MRDRNA2_/MRDRNA2_138939_c0_seq1.p1  ORF type:complete len:181 (+),score=35.87 gnl/MRDRNA2_/MRDRNA2_138939_c0_seq1:94-636(+)